MTVMIVDDDARMRAVLAELCSPMFSGITEFNEAASAIAAYGACIPDYVFMDILLPGMDGIEATWRITSTDPAARVYIVTACDESAYRTVAKRAGARGFFLKDDLGALVDAVQRDMCAV